jgi:serine/threonine-protein kinase
LLRATKEKCATIDVRVASAIAVGLLTGIQAVHEAKSDSGEALDMVHRDVSPQNVIIGVDGIPRLVDFGVAKAVTQIHTTRKGQVKGTLAYMAPEQLAGKGVTRQTDVFAASAVIWELLTRERVFAADTEAGVVQKVLISPIEPPSRIAAEIPAALDDVVLKGLARDPAARWKSAAEMAQAIESAVEPASASRVGRWVQNVASDVLSSRAGIVARIERDAIRGG